MNTRRTQSSVGRTFFLLAHVIGRRRAITQRGGNWRIRCPFRPLDTCLYEAVPSPADDTTGGAARSLVEWAVFSRPADWLDICHPEPEREAAFLEWYIGRRRERPSRE